MPDAEVPLFARIVRAAVAQQDTIDAHAGGRLAGGLAAGADRPGAAGADARGRGGAGDGRTAPPAKVVINEYLDVARGFFTGGNRAWRTRYWTGWHDCCAQGNLTSSTVSSVIAAAMQ